MHTTSVTLLERVRDPGNQEAWQRFVHLYAPLLYSWASRTGLQDEDAADLVQEVFALLVQKLRSFEYDRARSFRGWLRTILQNKWREVRRRRVPRPVDASESPLADLADPDDEEELSELAYRRYLVQRGLQLLEPDLTLITRRVWEEYVMAGRAADDVARELGITTHAVYLAKARVLRRLREELNGLLDV